MTEHFYGHIERKVVIYQGESFVDVDGVEYVNVAEYLIGLEKNKRN